MAIACIGTKHHGPPSAYCECNVYKHLLVLHFNLESILSHESQCVNISFLSDFWPSDGAMTGNVTTGKSPEFSLSIEPDYTN